MDRTTETKTDNRGEGDAENAWRRSDRRGSVTERERERKRKRSLKVGGSLCGNTALSDGRGGSGLSGSAVTRTVHEVAD